MTQSDDTSWPPPEIDLTTELGLDDTFEQLIVWVELFDGTAHTGTLDVSGYCRKLAEVATHRCFVLRELADWVEQLQADGWVCGFNVRIGDDLSSVNCRPPRGHQLRVRDMAAELREKAK